jgi:hypothetical protein
MSSSFRRAAAVLFLFTIATTLFAATPWDGKPFASDPKELLAAAAAVEPKAKDEGVVVLLDESSFIVDGQGRVTRGAAGLSRRR